MTQACNFLSASEQKIMKDKNFKKACYFMKLDYRMSCRGFVMIRTKKAQKEAQA